MVEVRRVELLTSCLQGRRSSQLSYTPKSKLIFNVLKSTLKNKQYSLETFTPYNGGDPAAPSDTATLLRLYPNHWFYLRLLPLALAHRLRAFPTLMVWRALCTRPGNVFTAVCWPAITSNSDFMKANFSLQSELWLLFGFCSISLYCFPLLQPL